MRIEHKKNLPLHYGNVREVAPLPKDARGKSCSRCHEPATRMLRNAYRSSTICDDKDCRRREENWVGNLPQTPTVAPGSWATVKQKTADDRSFRVKRAGS